MSKIKINIWILATLLALLTACRINDYIIPKIRNFARSDSVPWQKHRQKRRLSALALPIIVNLLLILAISLGGANGNITG